MSGLFSELSSAFLTIIILLLHALVDAWCYILSFPFSLDPPHIRIFWGFHCSGRIWRAI